MKRILALTTFILCLGIFAFAQNATTRSQGVKPMFVTLPPTVHAAQIGEAATTPLQTWNGSFVSGGTTYNFNMVGTRPSTNTTATVHVVLIPLKIIINNRGGSTSAYDPSDVAPGTQISVTNNTLASPIFSSAVDFTSGGQNMGSTQYIDAFQRANFWGTGDTSSHLLLGGPTVEPEETLNVPKQDGKNGTPFGFSVGLVNINYFNTQLHNIITNLGITPNEFPIFLTYDVYLTQNNQCCIGGYHSATGSSSAPQSYAHASYIGVSGKFAQDVSALSHEVGEWADDPLVVNSGNNTPCGMLEVGDPLENTANFGDFPYTSNGFTYHLQDLVTLPYFGAPPSTSVNSEFTFKGQKLTVCQNGS